MYHDRARFFWLVTAKAAAKVPGLNPSRHYGYFVLGTPKRPAARSTHPTIGVEAWCKTKAIATQYVADHARRIRAEAEVINASPT